MLQIEKLKISVYMYLETRGDVIDREVKNIDVHIYGETEQGYR